MSEFEELTPFEEQIRAAVAVPNADPVFVRNLRGQFNHQAQKPKPRFALQWAWVGALVVVAVLLAVRVPGVASAVRQIFGFVPGIGVVEPHSELRALAEPVSLTRDGVTLTVDQVVVSPERIELAYSVSGLNPAPADAAVCSGADMYPNLRLPDGALLTSDPMALGGTRLADGYTAGHSFTAALPAQVNEAAFVLKCLQDAPLDAAPQDWELPFTLVAAPDGVQFETLAEASEPVQTVETAAAEVVFEPVGGTLQADGLHFFFRFSVKNTAEAFLTAQPAGMYLVDSSGARIDLINALPWSPYDTVDVWEYRSVSAPAAGPLTVVIEDVVVYYQAQAATFAFTPGENASVGQTWDLDQHLTIGGYGLTVQSATLIELEGHPGVEFTLQSDQPGVKINAEVMDMSAEANFWSTTGASLPAETLTTGFVYESTLPETVQVTFNTFSVQLAGAWQTEWNAQP